MAYKAEAPSADTRLSFRQRQKAHEYRIPTAQATSTIAELERVLEDRTDIFATIDHVYVVDEKRGFSMSCPFKDEEGRPAKLISVQASTDQEQARRLAFCGHMRWLWNAAHACTLTAARDWNS